MHKHEIIQKLIDNISGEAYLEIGLDKGINFNTIRCKNKISVDPALGQYIYAKPTYKMSSDEFFKKIKKTLMSFLLMVRTKRIKSKKISTIR